MKAVVLAGGYGTRLHPLTYSRPKPMLPIGPKPVLQYVIETLARQGFDEMIITTNYLRHQIENCFGDGSRFGVTLHYPIEDKALGTAGSVKNAERFLKGTFAVVQGDNITDINVAKQLKYHESEGAMATIGVIEVDKPWRYGVATLDKNNRVVGFQEKPPPRECQSNLANTGLYIIEQEILQMIPKDKPFDFAKDLFPKILDMRKPLHGYRTTGFWADVGSVEGLLEASSWLLEKLDHSISQTADVAGAKISGPVWIGDSTVVEKGVRIRGPAYIEDSCVIRKNAMIAPGTMIKRNTVVGDMSSLNSALVFGSADINSKVTLNRCILDERCEIGSNTEIDYAAVIGAGCKIGENVVIGQGVKLEPGIAVEKGKVIRM